MGITINNSNNNSGTVSISGVTISIGGQNGGNINVGSGNVQVIETNNNYGRMDGFERNTEEKPEKAVANKQEPVKQSQAKDVEKAEPAKVEKAKVELVKANNDTTDSKLRTKAKNDTLDDLANQIEEGNGKKDKWINLQPTVSKNRPISTAEKIRNGLKDELTPEQLKEVEKFGGDFKKVEQYLKSIGITHIKFCF